MASVDIQHASDSMTAGQRLAAQLRQDELRSVFVLSDGLGVNGSELIKGLHTALPEDVVIAGGLAGNGDRFQRTGTIWHGNPASGTITAVGFYGQRLRVIHGSRDGWQNFGPERRITRSAGNILYELDGQPTLALYRDYLGQRAAGMPATGLLFPLSIGRDAHGAREVVRTILGIDDASVALIFAGDVPEGSSARLMRDNFERLVNGASEAADRACSTTTRPVLAVAVSCIGRRLVLGGCCEEETSRLLSRLPAGTQQVGFYS